MATQRGVECTLTCPACDGTGQAAFCDLDCPECQGAGSTIERVGADLHTDLARARTPLELADRLETAAEGCEADADLWRRFRAHQKGDLFAGEAAALRVVAAVLREMLAPRGDEPTSAIRKLWRRVFGGRAA